jgi:hypothetical protein
MRKHLFLAIAATCLLTTFLIGIVPIQSQTASPYDPWLDYNDDGKIDGRDLIPMSRAFVSYGDPTKNVTVTNWPTTPLHNYTDAEEITVYDASRMINGTEYGDYVVSSGGWFAFSPKQNFIAVTDFTYMIQAYKEGVGFRLYYFSIEVNGVTVSSDYLEITDYYPGVRGNSAPLAVNLIKPGINNLHVQFVEWMFLLKVTVFVEYQYQA